MPARKPRALKELAGTLRPCRDNARAPRLEALPVPPPPRGLSPAQRRVWLELAPQVEALRVYDAATLTGFRLLVVLVAAVETKGEPASARARNLQAAMTALGRWGLDPASREKVSAHPELEDDDLSEFGLPIFGHGNPAALGRHSH